jgi:hypothetical protein
VAGFIIPNAVGLTYPDQSAPDQRDFEMLNAGMSGVGMLSGCAVSASGSSLVLTVASGSVQIGGNPITVAGNTATVTTAHASNPRYDLVVVDATGVASIIAGTAAASPVFPSFTAATQVVLAAVYVPATATTLAAANLVDKRVTVEGTSLLGELDSLSNAVDFTIPNTNTWTNVTDVIAVVPANVPWECVINVIVKGTRTATADSTVKKVEFRAVDVLTETTQYAYVPYQSVFTTVSVDYYWPMFWAQDNDPVSAELLIRLQARASNSANMTWSTYSALPATPGQRLKVNRR